MKRPLLILTIVFSLSPIVVAEPDGFQPEQSTLPVKPPKDAIVLFDDGKAVEFVSKSGDTIDWPVEDGSLVSSKGQGRSNHLCSAWHFRDADVHVEFLLPEKGSGNSGIYIHGNYELQIIHSHGKEKLEMGMMGAIYGFHKPLVNAARPRDQWQVFDIRYRAPRRDEEGSIVEEGSITAWLNSEKVQDNARVGEPRSKYHPYRYGTTPYLQEIWKRQKETMTGPVFLQDHDNPVKFRNVWIRPLDDKSLRYELKE